MTGLRRSTIYRMQASGQFPQRIKIGARAVGWIEREVQEWLAKRVGATLASGTRKSGFRRAPAAIHHVARQRACSVARTVSTQMRPESH
jgi:prophage regulatory protein